MALRTAEQIANDAIVAEIDMLLAEQCTDSERAGMDRLFPDWKSDKRIKPVNILALVHRTIRSRKP